MKLVLLPGMDGTGILFERLLANIHDTKVVVLPLPSDGPQDYTALSEYISRRLPDDDFILVAESFSGGIAAVLSQQAILHLKGIIFVASFLSGPKRLAAYLSSFLPIRNLTRLPFSEIAFRYLFLGKEAGNEEIELFRRAIAAVPEKALKQRLKVIAQSKYDGFQSLVPAVYLGAMRDNLVPLEKRHEFVRAYNEIAFSEIDGPRFILQAKPKEGVVAIVQAASLLVSSAGCRTGLHASRKCMCKATQE